MAEHDRSRLLVLTSTFPRWQDDHEPAFVFELARRLTDSFDVTVLAPHAPGAADAECMDGVSVERFHYAPERLELLAYDGGIPSKLKRRPWLSLLVPWFLTAQLLAAFRMMRRLRPDVVHAHWLLPSGLIGALLQEMPGAEFRLVVTAHGADVHLTGSWLSRTLKREILRSADLVTVVSKALRDKLSTALPSARFKVAPMGVDLQTRFVPLASDVAEPILVFAGRLVEKKGVIDLLNAMPAILEYVENARLLIAGDGPLADELRGQCKRLTLDDAVEFLGSVPNDRLPEVLRRGQLAILPFRVGIDGDQEGLGLTTIEAMGCGVPVLVAEVPAVHDVVQHDRNGWLVTSGQPKAIADAAIALLQNPQLRQRLAAQARDDVLARFDWAVAADRYRQLLASSLV